MGMLKKFFKKEKGGAAIEFAFILPIFLLFMGGIIEWGYILWAQSSLNYSATLGARYAFVHPTFSNTQIQSYIMTTIDVPSSDVSFTVTGAGGLAVNINGTLTYSFLLLPLDPITVTVNETQVLPLPG